MSTNIEKFYDLIQKNKNKYGSLKKGEFHLHTPASHDYKLIQGKEYSNLSIDDVITIAEDTKYLNQELTSNLRDTLTEYTSEEYLHRIHSTEPYFRDFKEYLSFMLIAHQLYSKEIDFVVVCDHNTVDGYHKLAYAVNKYFVERIKGGPLNRKAIQVFLGVEITCSENNHLIGIFNKKDYRKINNFLNEIILSKESGTYYTSYQVMEELHSLLGSQVITYIAHLNTSEWVGTGAYKKQLFSSDFMHVLGCTNLTAKPSIFERVSAFCPNAMNRYGIIHESDSHSLKTIGLRNTWIKFSSIDFPSLQKSFKDHKINIYPEKPQKSNKFIKAIYVIDQEEGFLSGDEGKGDFFIEFSRDLNCIIGGRGTGKSTILHLLETILSNEVDNLEKLKFLSRHKQVLISFVHNSDDYIVRFTPQIDDKAYIHNSDNIKFLPNAILEHQNETFILNNWVELFKVSDTTFKKLDNNSTKTILNQMFKRGYSINKLVSMIDNGQIGSFIKDIVLNGTNYNYSKQLVSTGLEKGFKNNIKPVLEEIIVAKNRYDELIKDELHKFNEDSSINKILKIVFSPKEKDSDHYLRNILRRLSGSENIANTYLTWDDLARYVALVSEKIGFLEFLRLLVNNRFLELEDVLSLDKLIDPTLISMKEVESGLEKLNKANKKKVYANIKNTLINNKNLLVDSIQKYLEIIDDFSLEFNINSKEDFQAGTHFKDIHSLSLGQKVVALLTFIFQFGLFINDNTPLIIDQPEDNLDNQYIYKNLVKSLREIKNSRQVIIVTHSSTIVTNADAEQVIVMRSNNEKAWIAGKGYPSDATVTRHILFNLEGGIDSFKHKMGMYKTVLTEQLE